MQREGAWEICGCEAEAASTAVPEITESTVALFEACPEGQYRGGEDNGCHDLTNSHRLLKRPDSCKTHQNKL